MFDAGPHFPLEHAVTTALTNLSTYTPNTDATPVTDPFSLDPALKAGVNVLVVDDDRTLREGCASVLQVEGYSVTTSARGDDALEQIKRRKFDLILVDLCMTPISGMEILRAALQAKKDTLVVLMTGNPTVASSVEALRAGGWDYLAKPFAAAHLQVLV